MRNRRARPPVVAGPSDSPVLPPQPSALIGRAQQVRHARDRLLRPEVRLLTLTGSPGTGKTRLAIAIAETLLHAFTGGVAFVDLSPLADPRLVLPTIAQACGVREPGDQRLLEALAEAVRPRQLLLVLDNFEHVLSAGPDLADLLVACPNLKLLVTSRERLRLRWEQELPVPPLAVPDLRQLPPVEHLAEVPAVALFLERARAARPEFALTADNVMAVAQLCVRLDGLPLALELAAAQTRLMPPQALLARLGQRFDLLVGGPRDLPARQQTLRAALTWSYDLLPAAEQAVFRRLGVFAGAWALEAAEAVGSAASGKRSHVLQSVSRLVDASLVAPVDHAGEPRYRLLESVGEYALERLALAGELDAARRAQAQYFTRLAERAEPELTGPDQASWLALLEQEHDNLRAALRWAVSADGDAEVGLRLGGALWRFWWYRGHLQEGLDWLQVLLARGGASPSGALARVLIGVGVLARDRGDHQRARDMFERSLAMAQALQDQRSLALSLTGLAGACLQQGDLARAAGFYQECLDVYRDLGDRRGMAIVLDNLGQTRLRQGDLDQAAALCTESLHLLRALDDKVNLAACLHNLGDIAREQGAFAAAQVQYAESLATYWQTGDRQGVAECLEGLAAVAAASGDAHRTARLLGAARAFRQAIGVPVPPSDMASVEQLGATACAALGTPAFRVALAEGEAMDRDHAIAYALGGAPAEGAPDAVAPAPALTPREREVAELVARGLTNRQIAEALVISERTAEGHVERLRNKLGCSSRAQVAVWAAQHGLAGPTPRVLSR
jgi:non-specific serine/threonine protein kinase